MDCLQRVLRHTEDKKKDAKVKNMKSNVNMICVIKGSTGTSSCRRRPLSFTTQNPFSPILFKVLNFFPF